MKRRLKKNELEKSKENQLIEANDVAQQIEGVQTSEKTESQE